MNLTEQLRYFFTNNPTSNLFLRNKVHKWFNSHTCLYLRYKKLYTYTCSTNAMYNRWIEIIKVKVILWHSYPSDNNIVTSKIKNLPTKQPSIKKYKTVSYFFSQSSLFCFVIHWIRLTFYIYNYTTQVSLNFQFSIKILSYCELCNSFNICHQQIILK